MSHLSALAWAEAARMENELSNIMTDLSYKVPKNRMGPVSEAFEDSSAVMGINPPDEVNSPPKGVRFSDSIKVIEVPEIEGPEESHVSFNDNTINIDVATTETEAHPRTNKHVRFGCLKQPKQPLSHGLLLLQMLRRRTLRSTPISSTATKKQVRFGALKCQKTKLPDLTFGQRDTEWDEAETRRVFKRECMKKKILQPLFSIDEVDGEDFEGSD